MFDMVGTDFKRAVLPRRQLEVPNQAVADGHGILINTPFAAETVEKYLERIGIKRQPGNETIEELSKRLVRLGFKGRTTDDPNKNATNDGAGDTDTYETHIQRADKILRRSSSLSDA